MSCTFSSSAGYALFSRTTDTIFINGHTFVNSQMTIEAEILIPFAFDDSSIGAVFEEQTNAQCDKGLAIGPNGVNGSAWTGAPNNINDPGIHVTNETSLDEWHHVAFVRDTVEQRVYLDGMLIGTRILTGTPYDDPISNSSRSLMAIGGLQYTDGRAFDGSFLGEVQWVRVSDVARYSGTSVSPPTTVPTTDAYTQVLFDFTGVAPGTTTLNDLSGNGFVGTVATGFSGATAPTFVPNPPYITSEPQSQIGYWGQSVTFSVTASPISPPLSYQWLSNSVPISGATNQTLLLTNLQNSFAAAYTVVVTNLYGSVASFPPANLTIEPANVAISLYPGVLIAGVAGLTYGIQYSTNLANTNGWIGLTNLALITPTEIWYDSIPASLEQRFYRVLEGPIPIP